MASEKNITMRQYNGVDYDTLYPKTIASQVEDVYNKKESLSANTAVLLGLETDALPDETLMALKNITDSLEDTAVQMAFGTYVGTGLADSSNKNVLTFDFVPLLVLIAAETSYSVGLIYAGQVGAISTIDSNSLVFEQTGTSLYWYARSLPTTQMNVSGTTYVYRAIGLKESQI